MIRNITIVVSGIVLSFLLLMICGWIMLQLTPLGHNLTSYGEAWYEHGDPFELMRGTMSIINLLILPLIAVVIGVFVGFLAHTNAWQLALLSLAPLLILFLTSGSWSVSDFGLVAVYLLLAAASSTAIRRTRKQIA